LDASAYRSIRYPEAAQETLKHHLNARARNNEIVADAKRATKAAEESPLQVAAPAAKIARQMEHFNTVGDNSTDTTPIIADHLATGSDSNGYTSYATMLRELLTTCEGGVR
jgi:hypothetical protein